MTRRKSKAAVPKKTPGTRALNRLTSAFVNRDEIPQGMHADGGGLYLQVKDGRSWTFRYMIGGVARQMGLGRLQDVSLAQARDLAADARAKVALKVDPLAERDAARTAAKIEAAKVVTFEAATEAYLKFKTAEFRNAKHAAQWAATLKTYAYPVIGSVPVRDVDTEMVKKILVPIWLTKTETATRLRQRIEAVLNSAFLHMNPRPDNPARWKGHLDGALPKPTKIRKAEHFEAMDYNELPDFFGDLVKRENVSAQAMAFAILTAARSGEVRMACFEEIDRKAAVWTVPAERMKAGRIHRVPLSPEALALIPKGTKGVIFPNRNGDALSDTAMRKYLQDDMKRPGLTVHGFRSSFRQWVKDRTNVAGEIAEAALAHVNGDKTELAYDRSDALERRRQLMTMWARYCVEGTPATGDVIPLHPAEVVA